MTHHWVTCHSCKTQFAMADSIYNACLQRAGDMSFWCPNGHSQVFVKGESAEDKLRRERDRALQQIAQRDDEIRYVKQQRDTAERRVSAAKGQITKIKKRAANGVCPCCNRTFADLARHMAGKHPGFVKEPTADELVTVN